MEKSEVKSEIKRAMMMSGGRENSVSLFRKTLLRCQSDFYKAGTMK